ncbi:hypothetical protein O181_045975 [Austropuccinia psidii MF-1]|uniref:Uncharacterized protein n=1 Tax=Austropuccinia psidii MF-1 TaxID=1389203 RepID=A0A9Q3HLQ4_9BASI|nr:hypothetical protein [Austropuccinia psidii MF-1]
MDVLAQSWWHKEITSGDDVTPTHARRSPLSRPGARSRSLALFSRQHILMASQFLRRRAIKVYKELLRLSPHYPDPSYDLAAKTRKCFQTTKQRLDSISSTKVQEDEMAKAIAKAQYVRKEVEALIFLSRYRELKRRYGDTRHLDNE